MNLRVSSTIGVVLGFLGVLAWVWLVPYSTITAEEWGTALALLCLAALILVITISSVALINSYWVRFAPALRWLRPLAIVGVTAGLVGTLAWLPWAYAPPICASTGPIAPGVCPPVPSAAEGWAVLVALILMINVSSFMLFKSSHSRPRPFPLK